MRALLFTLLLSTTALAQQKTEPRSPAMFGGGIAMVIVGPIAALTGAGVLASAHGTRTCFGGITPCTTTSVNRGEIAAGAIVLSIGATAALGGLVMIVLGSMRVPVPVKADVGGLSFELPL